MENKMNFDWQMAEQSNLVLFKLKRYIMTLRNGLGEAISREILNS